MCVFVNRCILFKDFDTLCLIKIGKKISRANNLCIFCIGNMVSLRLKDLTTLCLLLFLKFKLFHYILLWLLN